MCGRYSLATPDPAQLRARFPIGESLIIRQRYNVAPGDQVLAVTTDREGAPRGEELKWGLVPNWAAEPNIGLKMINARSETAFEKPAFRSAMERFSCLIIADGFYEWQKRPGQSKQPYWITRADGEPFAFAGLWSKWWPRESPAGSGAGEPSAKPVALRTCTILTTAANPAIAELHDRMPVILSPGSEETAWLDRSTSTAHLHELLHGLTAEQTGLRPVGTAVNNARYDGPDCLEPPEPEAQASLF